MNLNDHFRRYFVFDLSRYPLEFRYRKVSVRGSNERDPDVNGPHRYLPNAITNIGTFCGEGIADTNSSPMQITLMVFSDSSGSPP